MTTPIEYTNYSSIGAVGAGASSVTVREDGVDYAPPPQDANDLRAQQYPSAAVTPGSASGRRPLSRESISMGTHSAASPSDMFGGVDQLIRDSQDWVYRDQAQFATGFENWNPQDLEPNSWPNEAAGGAVVNAGPVGPPASMGMRMPSISSGYGSHVMPTAGAATTSNTSATSSGAPTSNGGPRMNWLNGSVSYISMPPYNESEWYQ